MCDECVQRQYKKQEVEGIELGIECNIEQIKSMVTTCEYINVTPTLTELLNILKSTSQLVINEIDKQKEEKLGYCKACYRHDNDSTSNKGSMWDCVSEDSE